MDRTSPPIHTRDLPWIPAGPGIWIRPLQFAGDERTLQLKVAPGVSVGLHRHTGDVHAFNVSGERRLGTGEVAGPGAYVYEPPGNVDCWSATGDEPCVVQITMSGQFIRLGDDGQVIGVDDTASLRRMYLAWCAENDVAPWALDAQA